MNSQERLILQQMVKSNNTTDQTNLIRELKHSAILKKDIDTLLALREKYEDIQTLTIEGALECNFLYTYYTDLFNKIKKNEIDVSILYRFLDILNKIEKEEIDQHEGSYEVGLLLKKIYVDSALKKAEKLDSENPKEEYKRPQEKISWKDWKK
jgi:hypothetical protein